MKIKNQNTSLKNVIIVVEPAVSDSINAQIARVQAGQLIGGQKNMPDLILDGEEKIHKLCVSCGHNLVKYGIWVFCPNSKCMRTGLHTIRVLDPNIIEQVTMTEKVIQETSNKLKKRK